MIQASTKSSLSIPSPKDSMDGCKNSQECLRELDRKFEWQGRKVILIVDNCPAHPEIKGLKSIDLQFLQGVITVPHSIEEKVF